MPPIKCGYRNCRKIVRPGGRARKFCCRAHGNKENYLRRKDTGAQKIIQDRNLKKREDAGAADALLREKAKQEMISRRPFILEYAKQRAANGSLL